jgi:FlgD Ig-like domain
MGSLAVIRLLTLALVLLSLFAGFALANPMASGEDFLAKVDEDMASGVLNPEEALLIKFHHIFDISRVPVQYQVEDFAPLKCATPVISEFEDMRGNLSPETIELIESYLYVEKSRLAYTSPSGHFLLTYETSGSDAVPTLDTNPANGVPDYVEKVALYFDQSWESEVDTHGFQAPPIGSGTYPISFAQQQSYGYTTVVNSGTGMTRIVMHPNFQGFPPNDDPEGNVWGAAKVTAAHEFKHATQFITSRWSEGGWNEVDATWAEDLVFDDVNDYYNYLPGESPIRHPEISLDGGSTGTGSYEDCVWQIWMSETWGVGIITDYWNWRASHTGQSVMDSWVTILGNYGVTLAEGWAQFTAWNYGTGYRAVSGIGYGEADRYPYGVTVSTALSYPHTHSGTIPRLAANCIRLLGFDGNTNGTLDIQFNGSGTSGDMSVGIHIERTDGTGVIETMTLDQNNDGYYSCQVPLQEIQWAGIAVGNSATFGFSKSYDITVSTVEGQPLPGIGLDAESLAVIVESGETTVDHLVVENIGDSGSTLDFEVQVWGDPPGGAQDAKSVAGSTLTSNTATYLPGTTFPVAFTVFNGSTDEEWLTDVSLDFPEGVTLNSATDFVGGTYGPLVSNQQSGNGALISWHGTVGAESYGVIRENESAVATLELSVDSSFRGALTIGGTIVGDNYGSNPHSLNQSIILDQASAEMVLAFPNGGEELYVGSSETIFWDTMGGVDFVDVAVSRDGGGTWDTLAQEMFNTGSFQTVVEGPASSQALIRVKESGGVAQDYSDAEFSIVELVDWLTVTPLGGSLEEGQTENLTLDFDSAGLATGLHTAWLVINHNAVGDAVVVPVSMQVTDIVSSAGMPAVFSLRGNHPNPFNPLTQISFSLPAEAHTSVEVLDLRGRVVRNLFVGTMGNGDQSLTWDGKDDRGQVVAAGMYLARLRTVGYEATVKMTLAK